MCKTDKWGHGDRHVITPGTRLECVGTDLRPCPYHLWWYHEGKQGRPKTRCPSCRHQQKLIVKAESESEKNAPRCKDCGYVKCRCLYYLLS